MVRNIAGSTIKAQYGAAALRECYNSDQKIMAAELLDISGRARASSVVALILVSFVVPA